MMHVPRPTGGSHSSELEPHEILPSYDQQEVSDIAHLLNEVT